MLALGELEDLAEKREHGLTDLVHRVRVRLGPVLSRRQLVLHRLFEKLGQVGRVDHGGVAARVESHGLDRHPGVDRLGKSERDLTGADVHRDGVVLLRQYGHRTRPVHTVTARSQHVHSTFTARSQHTAPQRTVTAITATRQSRSRQSRAQRMITAHNHSTQSQHTVTARSQRTVTAHSHSTRSRPPTSGSTSSLLFLSRYPTQT